MRQVLRVCRSGLIRVIRRRRKEPHGLSEKVHDRGARLHQVEIRTRMSLWAHSRAYPFATNLSLISIPIGLLALVIGPSISRAFSDVFPGRPEIIYVWGVALLLGGLNVAHGIVRHIPSRERAGLYVLAVAYAFYGVAVLYGLGRGGMVTGPISLTLAVSAIQRARVFDSAAMIHLAELKTYAPVTTDVHTGLILPPTQAELDVAELLDVAPETSGLFETDAPDAEPKAEMSGPEVRPVPEDDAT